MINIIDDEGSTIEAFVLELSAVCGVYERVHDVELRAAIIRISTLDPPPDIPQGKRAPSAVNGSWTKRKLALMMEGPAASGNGNPASPNSIYASQQQQQQAMAAAGPMNGGAAQFSAAAPAAPTPPKPEDPNAKSLYVGSLDPRVTEQMLLEVFSTVRPVVGVKIIVDKRQNHGGLNYGFVEFANHQDAELALQGLNGRHILDSEIRVNWAFTSGAQAHEDTSSHFHIFVGDLSAEVNDQVLSKAFAVYPSMSDARVMWDMSSGKSRGYGFVAFRDRTDAEDAIGQMNGEWLGSRAIRVNWANQKSSKKHDSLAQQQQQPQQPLSYEAVRDQTAQYNTTVYVGNLTNYTTQEQLQQLFQLYGFVMEVRMQPERGFAFIKLDTHEAAAMAITQLHGTAVNGRPVKCSWGKDRVTDPKAAFGAIAAAAAANPAYTYPYVYGMPQQQFGVPGGAAAQQPPPPPPANNPQAWNNFAYDSYGYYGNPNYAQPGQMMPPATLASHSSTPSAAAPGSVSSVSGTAQGPPEGGFIG
ncbi:E3 ubiquitin-protein ligase pub1 [Coemansia guatemalensis]|uniref:E3 ubiquitin-protein ligase pub1 n=1 Tax=Coemansia guatemalensis TaxID=2761395 RepID=A0A9W8I7Q1_9FUNG|nr:E3 ubiquitin-protein ligase pub1 [Coemansia guatemalensis]